MIKYIILLFITALNCWADGSTYHYPEFKKIEIKSEFLGRCFGLLAVQYNKLDLFNRNEMLCHYHQEFRNKNYQDALPTIQLKEHELFSCKYDNKIMFDYLAAFNNRTVDYLTGKEPLLRHWVLSQKDKSVTPFILFEKSMSIHTGNAWNAILAIHQLLRNEFRWNRVQYYNYPSSTKLETIFGDKLVDIRGDLKERGKGFYGDHGGSWYRIWASMLDHLSHSTSNQSFLYLDQSKTTGFDRPNELDRFFTMINNNSDAVRNFIVGNGVEFYKSKFPHGKLDERKAELNVKGGEIAGYFVDQVISDKNYQNSNIQLLNCFYPSNYLSRTE